MNFLIDLMQTTKVHTYATAPRAEDRPPAGRFFRVGGEGDFFGGTHESSRPFFVPSTAAPPITASGGGIVQRQPQPKGKAGNFGPVTPTGGAGANRTGRCYTSPTFPNFDCLASRLKLDVDDNLRQNGHHLLRVATLFPDDTELQWNTFLRYGLGVNLLQTSFGFLGADGTLGTILSYGSGIGFKVFNYSDTGQLELDLPIPLGPNTQLDLKFNLDSNPNNPRDVRRVEGFIGISGSHDLL